MKVCAFFQKTLMLTQYLDEIIRLCPIVAAPQRQPSDYLKLDGARLGEPIGNPKRPK
jgi:hypothetical protein